MKVFCCYLTFVAILIARADSQACNFFRENNKIIIGYAEQVIGATDVNSCQRQCASAARNFQFTCLSGTFYTSGADADSNCILRSESKNTQPDMYRDEPENNVIYFEPNCL